MSLAAPPKTSIRKVGPDAEINPRIEDDKKLGKFLPHEEIGKGRCTTTPDGCGS